MTNRAKTTMPVTQDWIEFAQNEIAHPDGGDHHLVTLLSSKCQKKFGIWINAVADNTTDPRIKTFLEAGPDGTESRQVYRAFARVTGVTFKNAFEFDFFQVALEGDASACAAGVEALSEDTLEESVAAFFRIACDASARLAAIEAIGKDTLEESVAAFLAC